MKNILSSNFIMSQSVGMQCSLLTVTCGRLLVLLCIPTMLVNWGFLGAKERIGGIWPTVMIVVQ
jgi:hypothetical protein